MISWNSWELRFSAMSGKSLIALRLLPGKDISEEDIAVLEQTFGDDLPCPDSLPAEVRMWKKKWACTDSFPQNLQDTISDFPIDVPKHMQNAVFSSNYTSVQCWCRACQFGTKTGENNHEVNHAGGETQRSSSHVYPPGHAPELRKHYW